MGTKDTWAAGRARGQMQEEQRGCTQDLDSSPDSATCRLKKSTGHCLVSIVACDTNSVTEGWLCFPTSCDLQRLPRQLWRRGTGYIPVNRVLDRVA